MATATHRVRAPGAAYDAGLRDYMLRVYRYLAYGLLVSAASAYGVHRIATTPVQSEGAKAFGKGLWLTPLGETLYGWPGALGLLVVALGLLFAMSTTVGKGSFEGSMTLYVAFTGALGISLAAMVGRHAPGLVVQAASVTALAFGSMSLFGYTTKRDLSGMGSFLFMGLIALIGLGLLNALVFHSPALQLAGAYLGVLVFIGYLAYDTQTIKEAYDARMGRAEIGAIAVWGAMSLYLDVLNLLSSFLDILGSFEGGGGDGGSDGGGD